MMRVAGPGFIRNALYGEGPDVMPDVCPESVTVIGALVNVLPPKVPVAVVAMV
jgi:hypothetical protein